MRTTTRTGPGATPTARMTVATLAVAVLAGVLTLGSAPRARAATTPVVGDRSSITVGGFTWGAEIADVTDDGRDDLIFTEHQSAQNALLVYAQKGDGSLPAAPAVYPLEADPAAEIWQDWLSTSTGDLDDDGELDVVVGRYGGLEIFHGAGATLDDPVSIGATGIVDQVVATDLNGDGMDDLLYADDDGGHRIMRRFQTAPGTFGAAVMVSTSTSGRFSVGDANTDGRPDILIEDPWAVELQILLHDTVGQGFTSTPAPVNGIRSTAVGDVTGDGRNDVVALAGFTIWLLKGTAGGNLAAPSDQGYVYWGSSVEIDDMNGDARDDVLLFSAGNLDVLLQTDAGTLQARCPFPSLTPNAYAGVWSETAVGDLDGDGRLDAVAAELDETVRLATQIAPGTALASTIGVAIPDTSQINDPFFVGVGLDSAIPGCLGTTAIELWRKLPGQQEELLATLTAEPYDVAAWQASFQDDPGTLGAVAYRATWAGDAWREASQSSWQTVQIVKRATGLTLDATGDQILVGESTTLQATLQGGEPGSQVTFSSWDGGVGTPVGTAVVDDAGLASLEVSPVVPTTYEATYDGDDVWEAATSPQVSIQVDKHPTSLTLHAGKRLLPFGAETTLTARLDGGGIDRQVEFFSVIEGVERSLGTATPDGDGVATLDVTPKRNTRYLARYVGDETWAPVQSRRLEVQVHVLTSGAMSRFLRKEGKVAVYGCCRAYYGFKVKPNHGGDIARIELEVKRPQGGWTQIDTARFALRPDSTLQLSVRIDGAAGYTFRLTGCLKDHPDHRGWCSKPSQFRFLGKVAGRARGDALRAPVVWPADPGV